MSRLENFENMPYEEEYENETRCTEEDIQTMIKQSEIELKNNYILDKLKYVENEKEFYKSIIRIILNKKE